MKIQKGFAVFSKSTYIKSTLDDREVTLFYTEEKPIKQIFFISRSMGEITIHIIFYLKLISLFYKGP